jgi:hypothetical protein
MSDARRPILSLFLCTAVLLSAGTGVANGMVLCLADDGCLAIEFPHAKHAGCHHGFGDDADDAGDDTIAVAATNHSCTDATLGAQTVERSTHRKVAPSGQPPLAAILLPSLSSLGLDSRPSYLAVTGEPPASASLRVLSTIILLT